MPTEHVNGCVFDLSLSLFLTVQDTHLHSECYQGQLTVACDAAVLKFVISVRWKLPCFALLLLTALWGLFSTGKQMDEVQGELLALPHLPCKP